MRINPYRTTGNVIAGVVMTFTEMTAAADRSDAGKGERP
jgi:hypothetical protein